MKKRGQISIELVLTVAFALMMVLPLIILLFNYSASAQEDVGSNQAHLIARKITDAADSVYYLGYPSTTTLKLYMPENVATINISNREVILILDSGADASSMATVNLTGEISSGSGLKIIRISALEYTVSISEDEI